jgi:hypothetical protein
MTVRISFLGGLGDIGRNCASIEVGGKLALIDCGLMFPEEHMLVSIWCSRLCLDLAGATTSNVWCSATATRTTSVLSPTSYPS